MIFRSFIIGLVLSTTLVSGQIDALNGLISPLSRLHQRFLQNQVNRPTFEEKVLISNITQNIKNDKENITVFKQEQPIKQQTIYYKRKPQSNSVIDSLFEMNAKVINQNDQQINEEFHVNEAPLPFKENIQDISSMLINLYEGKKVAPLNKSGDLMNYLDNIRSDAWSEFKKMVMQYSGFVEDFSSQLTIEEKMPIDLIKKVLDLGDRVNFVHLFGKKVNPELLNFILNQFQPLVDKIPYFDKIRHLFEGHGSIASPISGLMKSAALRTLQQFAKYILNSAHPKVTEKEIMDYYKNLKLTNPISASGLQLILQLNDTSLDNREGKIYDMDYPSSSSYDRRNDYYPDIHRSDTSYGHGGLTLDPYLLLAGIGAAALLTFIAYRVIVTTVKRKKRDLDFGLMDESDVPTILTYVYDMIEDGDKKYNSYETTNDLVQTLNSMWLQSQNKNEGCIRCELFDYLQKGMAPNKNYIDSIIGASIGHLLGTDKPGQLIDDVMTELMKGNIDFDCKRKHNTCEVISNNI